MKALIYTRVSADASGNGRSVDSQEAECRAICDANGWEVVDVICDNDRSASRHAKRVREGWAEAVRTIESGGVDILVTWEASRAQRDLAAYTELRALCERTSTRWSYSGTTYDFADRGDRFRTGLDALLAEDESERIRDRVRRGKRASAAAGRPTGKLPYGYQRIYDERTRELVRQEPHPEQAPIVVEAVERILAGESARSICRSFNARGIPIPRPRFDDDGKRIDDGWQFGQLTRLLRNPLYAGLRVHQGAVVGEGNWEPLIERAQWQRLQALLADPARKLVRNTPVARLLTGVVRCGVCGGPCSYGKQGGFVDGRGRPRPTRLVYVCRGGQHTVRDMAALDAYVTAIVLERLAQPDAMSLSNDDDTSAELDAARTSVGELRARLDDATAAFTRGELTASTLGRIESELLPRIAEAEKAVRVVGLPSTAAELATADDVAARWDELSTEQQRSLIRALLTVTLLPAIRGSRTFDPSCVRVEWHHAS